MPSRPISSRCPTSVATEASRKNARCSWTHCPRRRSALVTALRSLISIGVSIPICKSVARMGSQWPNSSLNDHRNIPLSDPVLNPVTRRYSILCLLFILFGFCFNYKPMCRKSQARRLSDGPARLNDPVVRAGLPDYVIPPRRYGPVQAGVVLYRSCPDLKLVQKRGHGRSLVGLEHKNPLAVFKRSVNISPRSTGLFPVRQTHDPAACAIV